MVAFWKTSIVEGLRNLGGEADMVDVYKWLESMGWLGEKDLEDSGYGERPRYQHSLRACASTMVKKGELIRICPGRFRLPGHRRKPMPEDGT